VVPPGRLSRAPKTATPEAVTLAGEAEIKPVSSGYADVKGIRLYHEVYGQGEPLVLIHGGLTTIGESRDGCSRWRRRGR
jgi:hypothetical protein